jgi:hypothetical protein
MEIDLKPWKVTRLLIAIAVGMALTHIVGQLSDVYQGRTSVLFLFDLGREQSIPRFYSSVMLLLCSCLILTIAVAKKGDNTYNFIYWLGLVLMFLFLAMTKSIAIHENIATLMRSALGVSKIKFYAWVYSIVVVLFTIAYLKFFFSLPRRVMLLFVIGGSAFVAGAFGLDLVVAYLGQSLDRHTGVYIGLATLEELLEMGGIIIFVYTFLLYMSLELKRIVVRVAE